MKNQWNLSSARFKKVNENSWKRVCKILIMDKMSNTRKAPKNPKEACKNLKKVSKNLKKIYIIKRKVYKNHKKVYNISKKPLKSLSETTNKVLPLNTLNLRVRKCLLRGR